MTNKVLKAIIKNLSNAATPEQRKQAARRTMSELCTEYERQEAQRIFNALNIKTEDLRK